MSSYLNCEGEGGRGGLSGGGEAKAIGEPPNVSAPSIPNTSGDPGQGEAPGVLGDSGKINSSSTSMVVMGALLALSWSLGEYLQK